MEVSFLEVADEQARASPQWIRMRFFDAAGMAFVFRLHIPRLTDHQAESAIAES
jgi:hypothetical protein